MRRLLNKIIQYAKVTVCLPNLLHWNHAPFLQGVFPCLRSRFPSTMVFFKTDSPLPCSIFCLWRLVALSFPHTWFYRKVLSRTPSDRKTTQYASLTCFIGIFSFRAINATLVFSVDRQVASNVQCSKPTSFGKFPRILDLTKNVFTDVFHAWKSVIDTLR